MDVNFNKKQCPEVNIELFVKSAVRFLLNRQPNMDPEIKGAILTDSDCLHDIAGTVTKICKDPNLIPVVETKRVQDSLGVNVDFEFPPNTDECNEELKRAQNFGLRVEIEYCDDPLTGERTIVYLCVVTP